MCEKQEREVNEFAIIRNSESNSGSVIKQSSELQNVQRLGGSSYSQKDLLIVLGDLISHDESILESRKAADIKKVLSKVSKKYQIMMN